MFWDTETDGHGGFRRPLRHNLMQIAWVVTDANCVPLTTQNMYVRGDHCVSQYVPHKITADYANAHGVEPQEAMDLFMADVVQVMKSNGYVVAHNAAFDMEVVDRTMARYHIEPHHNFGWDSVQTFCTMKDPRIVAHCNLKRRRGISLKYPKLEELYTKMHDSHPKEKLHDALGDVHVLRASVEALLHQNIISFGSRPETPRMECDGRACDMLVNASDIAVVSGMMTSFDRHPAEVAERVLMRHRRELGVSMRTLVLTTAELECARVLVQASKDASVCTSTTVLGKRERKLHDTVDAIPGINKEVASEAKQRITSRINCVYGAKREGVVVREHNIKDNNAKMYYIYGGEVEDEGVHKTWGIVGRVDGFQNNRLVEIKHRRYKLFTHVPPYERVQLEVYMRMTDMKRAVLIQKLELESCSTEAQEEVERDAELWEFVLVYCRDFFSKLMKLIHTEYLWQQWNLAYVCEDRRRVWDCL